MEGRVLGYTPSTGEGVIKGKDGKRYQFRVKRSVNDRYSYISYFETTGEWEEISIPLADMYPSFRGRKLDMANYSGDELSEISFLVSNKKAESFCLLTDWMKMTTIDENSND